MEFFLTIFLSRLGSIYASYLVCLNLINICLTPMFMYCNAIVVMVGERLKEHSKEELTAIPRVSLSLIIRIYISLSTILHVFKNPILTVFTNELSVLESAKSLLLFIMIVSLAWPFFEIYKYCLQSFGNEKQVLLITFLVNMLSMIILALLYYLEMTNIYNILLIVSFNYLFLANWFRNIYNSKLNKIN